MAQSITVTPAYGRDYKTNKAAKEAWNENKDWIINCYGHPYDGKPINKSQADNEGYKIFLRFAGNRKVCSA